MKTKVVILLINVISLLYAGKVDNDFSAGWDASVSYGLFSEKTLGSMAEFSKLYNLNSKSEFYISAGSSLFMSGIGFGYKQYHINKTTSSIFISLGTFLTYLGTVDDGMSIYGFSISPGYSIWRNKLDSNFNYYTPNYKSKKSAINIGFSILLFGDKSVGLFPYVNYEVRY